MTGAAEIGVNAALYRKGLSHFPQSSVKPGGKWITNTRQLRHRRRDQADGNLAKLPFRARDCGSDEERFQKFVGGQPGHKLIRDSSHYSLALLSSKFSSEVAENRGESRGKCA